MIHYQLRCGVAHEFDAWFRDSATFEDQASAGLLECPHCGERRVARALMAPAVPRRRGRSRELVARELVARELAARELAGGEAAPEVPGRAAAPPPAMPPELLPPESLARGSVARDIAPRIPDQVRAVLQRMRSEVEQRCEYVGPGFAAEARRIHDGESTRRGIYGEATPDEAAALAEDGIEVAQIPWLPRADA